MKKNKLDGFHLGSVFDDQMASYAQKNLVSRGRLYLEKPDPNRLPFQRDRDRIIHSTAFRRLRGKMQVVSPSRGDHFRNRLSHTIEVTQIARDLARQLRLNEDLVEAVALAHDLGHPPFGHAGERALDRCMQVFGAGFDHNKQSLRIVEQFESRYSDFPGLNLSQEVLEGIQKHEPVLERSDEVIFSPHLEAQLVDISDEIAYLAADMEDGLRGDFFVLEDLRTLALGNVIFEDLEQENLAVHPALFNRRLIKHLLSHLVTDTEAKIKDLKIETLSDVQQYQGFVVGFNPTFYASFVSFKRFLFERYYSHPITKAATDEGEQKIVWLFGYLMEHPEVIPADFFPETDLPRRVCDYIAGMTDAYLEQFILEQKDI